MSLALAGLIIFQLYWIDTVIRANEERFRKDVIGALQNVSQKLERQEIQRRMQAQNLLPPLIQQNGSIEFEVTDSAGIVRDVRFSLTYTEQGYELVPGPESGPNPESIMNDPAIQEELTKVNNASNNMIGVLQDMMFSNAPMQTRMSPDQLDSLITHELGEKGIGIDYDFGVIAPYQNLFLYLEDPSKNQILAKSELRASLFPNDLNGEYKLLVVDFPEKSEFLLGKIWLTMASSGILIAAIMLCFGYAVRTIVKQKKLSEMKTDFINNMTHELKTPIATVGLAVEALQDKSIRSEDMLQDRYLGMIGEENKRLGQHVEKVLQMAAIEKKDVQMKLEFMNLHELVKAATRKMALQIENREGSLKTVLNAKDQMVKGDGVHLMNVVVNLLDNANKYSPEKPNIVVRTEKTGKNIVLSVQDHGLGMSKEAVRNIFQKFYRVPTGNVHNVKGFGLGLAYVKNVVEDHHGSIDVQSEPGKGSKFFITLPLHYGDA
ncbi:MAG: HAMP domain-containing sensor histidine kinase [Cytophagales bacterium]|nr:HAMP domain-containing sensor histidine kinase [Cytophagales bacterium]